MKMNRRSLQITFIVISLWIVSCTGILNAQSEIAPVPENDPVTVSGSSQTDEAELGSVQEQLLKLVRLSPNLTSALANDPSLLGYPEYVNKNNPELAKFLEKHPEIVRNPEFYLFSRLPGNVSRDSYPLTRLTFSGVPVFRSPTPNLDWIIPFLIFLVVVGAVLWLLRLMSQNRRWKRLFLAQTEVHTKLLDKLGGSQELLSYLETDAGKQFMDMSSISGAIESPKQPGVLNPISRMLAPLQIGIVSLLVGIGILLIRTKFEDTGVGLVIGTVGITLGIGLMLSSGVSWFLAHRLGLISKSGQKSNDS